MDNNKMMEFDSKMRILFDAMKHKDYTSTFIQIRNELGEIIHEELHNKVVVAGSAFTMQKHYNKTAPVILPTYNEALGLDNTITEEFNEPGIRREEQVYLFCVGNDGCGTENHDVKEVDYRNWISPSALVPFRVQINGDDLTPLERNTYMGRKTDSANNRIYYYFKEFDKDPELVMRYVDGTPIDANIYNSTNVLEAESYVELKCKVDTSDCREYYRLTTGINDARINCISILTAWKKVIDGQTFYQDIRPLTRLNFPNEPLIQDTKSLDITYITFY